jgi:hypothetical protein
MRKPFNRRISFVPPTLKKKLIVGVFCGTLAVFLLTSNLGSGPLEEGGGKYSNSTINNGDVPLEQDDPKLIEYIKKRHMTPPSKKPYELIGYKEGQGYNKTEAGYTGRTAQNTFVLKFLKNQVRKTKLCLAVLRFARLMMNNDYTASLVFSLSASHDGWMVKDLDHPLYYDLRSPTKPFVLDISNSDSRCALYHRFNARRYSACQFAINNM